MDKDAELRLKQARLAPEDPDERTELATRIARLEAVNASRRSPVLEGQIAKLKEIKATKDAEGGS